MGRDGGGKIRIPLTLAQIHHRATVSRLSWALIDLALLCGSAALGFVLKSHVLGPYTHDEALDFMSVITGFLVTTAAIVMGLLINSAKNFVDNTKDQWALYAAQLLRLDQCLRNYGPESQTMRSRLQSFTAAVIANCWRTEAVPTGVAYPDLRTMSRDDASLVLGDLLNGLKLEILRAKPTDQFHERLAADCLEQCQEFARARWSLISAPQSSIPAAFLRVLVFWLMTIFLCFGLRAPASPIAIVMIGLCAITLSSMLFSILDMVNPYDGLYDVSSEGMRRVLNLMLAHNTGDGD
jgi:hypothetical protein